jgi:hypothetical protein
MSRGCSRISRSGRKEQTAKTGTTSTSIQANVMYGSQPRMFPLARRTVPVRIWLGYSPIDRRIGDLGLLDAGKTA